MEGIGAEVSQKVKSAIKAKLVELGVYVDEELPDYIMVMVANKRTKSEMIEDLQLFLGTHTEKFISWLLQVLQKLHEVTVASLDAKRASSSSSGDKDKEKIARKKKLSSSEGEPESVKKDRKKKSETSKKDSGGKKTKKSNSLKKKSVKSDFVKSVEKKSSDKTEIPVKEKKDTLDKSKEQTSTVIEKSIPLNLPTTSRLNTKPVLMVSDEDDEDFINIRADAEADLLVSELQEEARPSPLPLKQLMEVPTAKSIEPALQRSSDKLNTSSQESSRLVPAKDELRDTTVSSHKDVRLPLLDEDTSVMQKASLESTGQISTKTPALKRVPTVPSPDSNSHHSQDLMEHQVDESKESEIPRVQPVSKVTSVSRPGNIKSRLGKRPSKQDSPTKLDRTKAKGLTSVVKVKGRPKVPLSAQVTKNLILKAMAEAQKSVASSLIRPEPFLKSHGLLTKKNRSEFSKIAVTLPNPRSTSTTQPVRRTLEDVADLDQLVYRPMLTRSMADSVQSHSGSVHNSLVPVDDMSSIRDFPPMRDLPTLRPMPPVRNLPSFRNLPSIRDLSPVRDIPSMRNIMGMSDYPSARNLPSIRNISPVRHLSPVRDLPSMRDIMAMSDRPTFRNLSSLDDLPSLRDMPILRDGPSILDISPLHELPQVRDLPAMDLQEPTLNLSQPTQNLSQSFQSQSQLSCSRSQLTLSQPQIITSQPQQPQSRSQLIQTQPQPDIVASLHEGLSSQSSAHRAGRNTVERMTMTEGVSSPADASNIRPSVGQLNSESECICPNHEHTRELEHASCSEGTCMCSDLQEESVEMREKPVTPVEESPTATRSCSPQFFVTLNGYDPRMPNGGGRVVRSALNEKSRRFLVPEGDDMDVDQEYMDDGIGEEDFKNDPEDVNETEMMDEEMEKGNHSMGPVIFRKISPETSGDSEEVPIKVKNPERCRFWPACRLGERCEFHHPTIPCKSFPACKFGDKCLYIHPNCKFDSACTRKDCPFTHAIPRSLVIAPVPAPVRAPARPLAVQCRFFPKCTNVNCKFYHPKPCRFGKACNKYDCPYMHEREQLPSKDKLKWVCPGKA